MVLTVATIAIFYAVYLGLALSDIGFPDGHRTEFEVVFESAFVYVFILNVTSGLFFLYLGTLSRLKLRNFKYLPLIMGVYFLFAFGSIIAWIYLLTHLENGRGG